MVDRTFEGKPLVDDVSGGQTVPGLDGNRDHTPILLTTWKMRCGGRVPVR